MKTSIIQVEIKEKIPGQMVKGTFKFKEEIKKVEEINISLAELGIDFIPGRLFLYPVREE
jgi:hypothetical protein